MSKAEVVTDFLNLRTEPKSDAKILEVLKEGAIVETFGRSWVNVKSAGGKVGWCAARYLEMIEDDDGEEPKPKPEPDSKMPWMDIAEAEIGEEEITGGENPRIIAYHAATTLGADEDEVPWCSSFVCWVLKQSGYKSTKSAWARSYEAYGTKLTEPKVGCIVVFNWGNGTGHVGFVTAFTATTVTVLGGNQSNSVNETRFSRANVSAWRWPVKA